jgi:hypothetical protein
MAFTHKKGHNDVMHTNRCWLLSRNVIEALRNIPETSTQLILLKNQRWGENVYQYCQQESMFKNFFVGIN